MIHVIKAYLKSKIIVIAKIHVITSNIKYMCVMQN